MKPVTHVLGPQDALTLADFQAAVRRLEAASVRRDPFDIPPWCLPDMFRLGPEWTNAPVLPK